jgi:branched-chain amino acid transport system permease protein
MNNIRTPVVLACLALALLFPVLFSNPAVTTIAVFTLIFALAATGWNIFSGYTRYISLGHAAFYGLGAYILMIFCQLWNVPGDFPPLLLLPVVGLVTGICAFPLGWVALKTNHYTFIAITIAIFTIVSQVPNLLSGITTGLSQLSLPIPLWSGDVYNLPFYYSALLLLVLALGVSWWIRQSKYGLGLLAIRDDEARAQGLGVNVGPFKLAAFIISAIFVGMAGALSAYFISLISPTSAFDTSLNIAIPLIVIFGGSGTLWGPIIGALIVTPLQQYLTLQFGAQNWDLILYGILFLLVIRLLPDGIIPALLKFWSLWNNPRGLMSGMEELPLAFAEARGSSVLPSSGPEREVLAASERRWPGAKEPEASHFKQLPVNPIDAKPARENSIVEMLKEAAVRQLPPGTKVPASSYSRELPLTSNDVEVGAPERFDPSTPQPVVAHSVAPIDQPGEVVEAIPLQHTEWSAQKELTQKVRAPRLVSLPQGSPASSPGRMSIPPTTQPCPRCSDPLWTWGDTHFCVRCGLTISGQKALPFRGGDE